ncbi:MAG: ABC transporter permease subunit [Oscillospiraceae bacterium]|nr:ABC transporter permease subunit [Oscillospiraceae bacterium]
MSDNQSPLHQSNKNRFGKIEEILSTFPMRVNVTIVGTILVLIFSLLEWVNMGLGVRFNLFTLQFANIESKVVAAQLEWVFSEAGSIQGFRNFKLFMAILLIIFVIAIILLALSVIKYQSKRFRSLSYWGFGAIILVAVTFIFAILITVGDAGTTVLSVFPLLTLFAPILTMFFFPFDSLARLMNYVKRYWVLYILLILPMAQIIIFRYGPMINILAAFKENFFLWPVLDRPWAGLEFFVAAFNDPTFLEAFRNTLVLSFLEIIMGFPVPIILAILLNELRLRKFKRVTQTILYLPHFLSWAIVAGIATTVLGNVGLVNNFLGTSIPFLTDPTHWIFSYVIIGIWKGMGWGTIIYLAAITGINPELYEAAAVDGAKRFRLIWHITLPGIRPVIVLLLILSIGGIMGNSFERIMAMRNPLVFRVSDVIEVFTYNRGVAGLQQSLAAAVGLFQSIVSVILLFGANYFAKKTGERGLL